MDTTETYIKMRLAAILDLGRGTPYLNTFCAMSGLSSFVDRKGDVYVWTQEEPNYCQLERQDQLQEMVKENPPQWLCLSFWWWVDTVDMGQVRRNYLYQFTSMEQLWLAFCMSELYKKEWSGTEWIPQTPQ